MNQTETVTPREFERLAKQRKIMVTHHWSIQPNDGPHRIIGERRQLMLDNGMVIQTIIEKVRL